MKIGNVNIQTVTAESPKSEDDDNFGRITDVMVTTKDFAQTSDLDEKYAALLCAAMTPIMPILAPNEPITYSQTIVDNRTRDFGYRHLYTVIAVLKTAYLGLLYLKNRWKHLICLRRNSCRLYIKIIIINIVYKICRLPFIQLFGGS